MMLIICHPPPRHSTGGVFSLQSGLDSFHKRVMHQPQGHEQDNQVFDYNNDNLLSCTSYQTPTDRKVCVSLDHSAPNPIFPMNHVSLWKRVKCTKCGETTKDHVGVCTGVTYPVNGSKVPAHLCKKCKHCGRNAVIHMLPGRSLPFTSHMTLTGEEAKVMTFECHECFPFDYVFRKEWNATPRNGKKLRDLNLITGSYTHRTREGMQVAIRVLSSTFKIVEN